MEKIKIGILIVGMNGATANTVIVGSSIKQPEVSSFGSILSSMIFKNLNIFKYIDFVFSGWDINSDNAFSLAKKYKIIPEKLFMKNRRYLESIKPLKAFISIYDTDECRESDYAKSITNFEKSIDLIKNDILNFKAQNNLTFCYVVYLGSPLAFSKINIKNLDKNKIIKLIKNNSKILNSSIAYAVASIESKCGFIDFTPNLVLEIPGINELALENNVPLAGRDGSTGQTLLKTLLADMFQKRNLKISGWYSTNILGNNDGLILSRPKHRILKMEDKINVIPPIVGYNDFSHVVDISYYLPRGDNKESWDNIDFVGWLNLPMSMKINWIGRDSILAAPLILDLVKHIHYSALNNLSGIQEHLAIYFKKPINSNILSFSDSYNKLINFYINKGEL